MLFYFGLGSAGDIMIKGMKMESSSRVQILDGTVYIHFALIPLQKA